MTAAEAEEAAPAKVNLYLRVLGRRAGDGHHLLDSLVAFAGAAADHVVAMPAEHDLTLTVEGPFAAALASEDSAGNLVLRAARALAEAAGPSRARRGAALRLTKRVPVAAGLGGGSADAAAALRTLDRLWGLGLGEARLAGIAAGLGADVPVCLAGRPARLGGAGEILRPAPPLPACGLLLVNPGLPLATPAVFAARQGAFSAPAELPAQGWTDAAALARDLAPLGNDLEPAAIALCPVVAEVLAALRALPSCLLARMSGSGATCFGLFASAEAAAAAAGALGAGGAPEARWWRAAGPLLVA